VPTFAKLAVFDFASPLPDEELKPTALVAAAGSLRSPAASCFVRHGLTPVR
jgi:hypothetical protein